jgi:hypothetical protein
MFGGVARLAGPMLKAFGKGLAGETVVGLGGNVPAALKFAQGAGKFVDGPIGNYVLNTATDTALGTLWGENPMSALGRSMVGNVGGTIGQKVIGAGLDKVGVNRGMQEFFGGTIINPASYALTEMAAMKLMPGMYGMDAQGNYVGDNPQTAQQPEQMLPGQMQQPSPEQLQAMTYQQMAVDAGHQQAGLNQLDRQSAQADFYFDQREKEAKAQQRLAKETYRRSLEQQFAGASVGAYGMLPPGIPSLEQQNQMYGGMR